MSFGYLYLKIISHSSESVMPILNRKTFKAFPAQNLPTKAVK